MAEKFDYNTVGLKCGLEIHQQLDSKEKLFCRCPTNTRNVDDSNFEFFRFLRPVSSEIGETDRAAIEQSQLNKKYCYKAYDSTCLIENDDEPPSETNKEALNIALTIAKLLHMHPVDQMHVMRKMVVDGSNTSGFQRTAFLAKDGYLTTSEGQVKIDVLCLEEEACQKIEDKGDTIVYSLDRLGIPLVEIGTAPDIISPAHAKETAQYIGMLLRSTGNVKRGIGTIRQDVNISISKGSRVELKGVQSLDILELLVEREVERQMNLLSIKDELFAKKVIIQDEIYDISFIFTKTTSKVIQKALKKGKVLAIKLPGFAGFVGREIQPGRRLGTEFSDRAKTAGVGGIFHTDELPNYGITSQEVKELRYAVYAEDEDAVVIVADEEQYAIKAIKNVIQRAKEVLMGVPEETRKALPDGNSSYLRPLPGAARMYPETDVPQINISNEYFETIEVPELLTEKSKKFVSQFNLNNDLANRIVYSHYLCLFEDLATKYSQGKYITPTILCRTFTGILPELKRDNIKIENLQNSHFIEIFDLIEKGIFSKEGIDPILRLLAESPQLSSEEAVERAGLSNVSEDEIINIIEQTIKQRQDFVQEKGIAAVGPLMGIVMSHVRGKVDGKIISDMLKKQIKEYLNK